MTDGRALLLTRVRDEREMLLRGITEKQWQAQVEAWAKRAGWMRYHTRISIGSTGGFPDLVLCRPPELVFLELKTDTGKVSAAQQSWIDALAACGQRVFVVRPSDEVFVRSMLA